MDRNVTLTLKGEDIDTTLNGSDCVVCIDTGDKFSSYVHGNILHVLSLTTTLFKNVWDEIELNELQFAFLGLLLDKLGIYIGKSELYDIFMRESGERISDDDKDIDEDVIEAAIRAGLWRE